MFIADLEDFIAMLFLIKNKIFFIKKVLLYVELYVILILG